MLFLEVRCKQISEYAVHHVLRIFLKVGEVAVGLLLDRIAMHGASQDHHFGQM